MFDIPPDLKSMKLRLISVPLERANPLKRLNLKKKLASKNGIGSPKHVLGTYFLGKLL